MNSNNFNENNLYNGGMASFAPPPPPEKLTTLAKLLFVVISSVMMILSGIWNMIGVESKNASILMLAGMLSMLVYIVIGGMCALLTLDSPRLSPLPPIVAFACVLCVFGAAKGFSPAALCDALFVVFPAVVGIIIAASMRLGAKRTGAIVAAAIGGGLFTIGAIFLAVFLSGETVSAADILKFVDELRLSMVEMMKEKSAEFSELYGYDFSTVDIEGAVNGAFNLLPAMFALIFSLVAFFSQLSLLALCRICNLYHKLEKKDTEFKVSAVTAVVFAVSYILSIFMTMGGSVAQAVAENLSMILLPALAMVGFSSVLPKREGNMIKVGCFPLVAVIGLLMFATSIAIVVLAFMGVWVTIKSARAEWRENKSKS